MPRLSLYKPEKGKDYAFLDRQISEMFTVGGTDLHLHKYLGVQNTVEGDATQPVHDAVKETNIQDLLFLENRDRKYDADVYTLRGIYSIQDIDFNMTQFGFMLDNDTLMLTVHINSTVKTVGRKIIAGDVLELPHLRDEYALNDYKAALKRYYVVEDVTRPSEGFSPTWYPHLYRLKLKQIVDSQEYKEILDLPVDEENPTGDTLRDLLSTYDKEMQINEAVIAQAEADAGKSGYDVSHYYTLNTDSNGNVEVTQVAGETVTSHPAKPGYDGYLIGDEITPNGESFGHGIQFPLSPTVGDYFLRTDFLPKRMFRYDGTRWIKVQDVVRMTMTNTNDRMTQKTSFINNTQWTYNERVVSDFLNLEEGDTTFVTDLDYPITGPYLALKYKIIEDSYAIADYPTLVTDDGNGKALITLPVVDSVQKTIPYPGQWEVIVFNNREAERQSLSQVLRPKADY